MNKGWEIYESETVRNVLASVGERLYDPENPVGRAVTTAMNAVATATTTVARGIETARAGARLKKVVKVSVPTYLVLSISE